MPAPALDSWRVGWNAILSFILLKARIVDTRFCLCHRFGDAMSDKAFNDSAPLPFRRHP
jgi:hypothetical protein